MTTIQTNHGGVGYLWKVLKAKTRVVTKAAFFRIPHEETTETNLKVGRYQRVGVGSPPETANPRSELTLDKEELENLVDFISENYKPLQDGSTQYISLDGFEGKPEEIESLKGLFTNPDQKRVLEFISENQILPDELLLAIEAKKRKTAIETFERMLNEELAESEWQRWFKENCWVLGTEFVQILDERDIDTAHISDYLMKAYDGFLDIVEIKRPETGQGFWAAGLDHGNYVPSSDLIKAVTQASRYIYEIERESNSVKFLERVGYVKAIKPRCVLIFGRSEDWNDEQKEAYRILNASYYNVSILTYDHVLARAKNIAGLSEPLVEEEILEPEPDWASEESPF